MKTCNTKSQLKENLPEIRNRAGIGLFVWDIKSDYLYWDEGMFNLFDVDKSDFKNNYKSFSVLLDAAESLRISETLKESIKDRSDFVNAFSIKTKDGSTKYIKAYSSFVDDLLVGVNIKINRDEYTKTLELSSPDDFCLIKNKTARASIYNMRKILTHPANFNGLVLTQNWTDGSFFGLNDLKYRVTSLNNNGHLQMEWLVINDSTNTHYINNSKLITNLGKGQITVWINGEENVLNFMESILIKSGAMHRIKYSGSCYCSVTVFDYFLKKKQDP